MMLNIQKCLIIFNLLQTVRYIQTSESSTNYLAKKSDYLTTFLQ